VNWKFELIIVVSLVNILVSCTTSPNYQNYQDPDDIAIIEKLENESVNRAIETTFSKIDTGVAAPVENVPVKFANDPDVPPAMQKKIDSWIEYFTVKDRERFQRFIARGTKFRGMIQAVLKEQGVPPDVFYLAMIESGFYEKAKSHASAVGVWQFIRGTGQRYGLKIDSYVDERHDAMRATVAAALYLKDLHNVFNSWYLAMAAYNSGENRVLRAIMKHNTRDFWELVEKRGLPKETMNYIPKIIAAASIGHSMEKYGFVKGTETYPALKAVSVPSPVRLSSISKRTGIPTSILEKYNPNIKRGLTPSYAKSYKIWVPSSQENLLVGALSSLEKDRVSGLQSSSIASNGYHRVRRGENLSSISRKYKTSVAAIKRSNGLRSNKIYAGQRLKMSSGTSYANVEYKRHRVKKGESLSSIARKFGTSIASLKELNRIKRNRIYYGQLIKVSSTGR